MKNFKQIEKSNQGDKMNNADNNQETQIEWGTIIDSVATIIKEIIKVTK